MSHLSKDGEKEEERVKKVERESKNVEREREREREARSRCRGHYVNFLPPSFLASSALFSSPWSTTSSATTTATATFVYFTRFPQTKCLPPPLSPPLPLFLTFSLSLSLLLSPSQLIISKFLPPPPQSGPSLPRSSLNYSQRISSYAWRRKSTTPRDPLLAVRAI